MIRQLTADECLTGHQLNDKKSRLIKKIAESMGRRGIDSKKVATRIERLYREPYWLVLDASEKEKIFSDPKMQI